MTKTTNTYKTPTLNSSKVKSRTYTYALQHVAEASFDVIRSSLLQPVDEVLYQLSISSNPNIFKFFTTKINVISTVIDGHKQNSKQTTSCARKVIFVLN
jgi:hypothetical protein